MAHMSSFPPTVPPSAVLAWRRYRWLLFLAGGIAVATLAFFGYGQPELLLEAVNLRYCG
jgi:hypothetical protein